MKTIFFICIALLYSMMSEAQNKGGFELELGDSTEHMANQIIPGNDGGYLLVGHKEMGEVSYTISVVDEERNYTDKEVTTVIKNAWVWKISAHGKLEWEKNIGQEETESEALAVTQCYDGGYAVACRENQLGSFEANYMLVRLDEKGQKKWVERHPTESDDTPIEIKQCADSTFIIMGNSVRMDYWDILIVKMGHVDEKAYNIEGDTEAIYDMPAPTIWELRYGQDDENEEGFSLALDGNGGCVIVGSILTNNETGYDALLLHVDGNGNVKHENIEYAPLAEDIREISRTKDGDYIVCGSSFSGNTYEGFLWIKKIDPNGKALWQHVSDDPMFIDAIGLYPLETGNFAIGYTTDIERDGRWKFVYLELSPDGKKQKEQSIEQDESPLSEASHFCMGSNGNCILAGTKATADYAQYFIWVKEIICTDE